MPHIVEEFSEDDVVEFNKVVARMDGDLQARFDAIQPSDPTAHVTAAEDALRALPQPLRDELSDTGSPPTRCSQRAARIASLRSAFSPILSTC